jgi:hypothetical protein
MTTNVARDFDDDDSFKAMEMVEALMDVSLGRSDTYFIDAMYAQLGSGARLSEDQYERLEQLHEEHVNDG